jgi:hypothetical protein
MALACQVVNNATAARSTPLQGLAAVERYFFADGSSDWCRGYTFNPAEQFVPDYSDGGYNSYSWQCCSEFCFVVLWCCGVCGGCVCVCVCVAYCLVATVLVGCWLCDTCSSLSTAACS